MSELHKTVETKIKELEKKKKERSKRKGSSTKLVTTPRRARRARRRPSSTKRAAPIRKKPRTYEEAKALYGTTWYKEWREYILLRDAFTCQMCGQKGGRLEVHHIRPKYLYPELTLDERNGITLCRTCHQGRVTKHEKKFMFIFDRIVHLNSGGRSGRL